MKKTTKRNYRPGDWQYVVRLIALFLIGAMCLVVVICIIDETFLYAGIQDQISGINRVAEIDGWTEKRIESVHQLEEAKEYYSETKFFFRSHYSASRKYMGFWIRAGMICICIFALVLTYFALGCFAKVIYRDYLKNFPIYIQRLKKYYIIKICKEMKKKE